MKKVRQRYYVAKELRLSIALIVLWSFLAVTFLTFVTKELSKRIDTSIFSLGYSILVFFLIMLGYAALVVFFTMFFSNRFIGPFERLKKEIRQILTGDYHLRLSVRGNDDIYIRSFITEINRVLDDYEKMCRSREGLLRTLDSELLYMISALEREDLSREKQRVFLLSFHDKLKSLIEEK